MGDQNSQDPESEPKVSFDHFVLLDIDEGGGLSSNANETEGTSGVRDRACDAVSGVIDEPFGKHPYRDALLKRVLASGKPKHNPTLTPDTAVAIAKYPHVLRKFRVAWGNPELFAITVKEFSVIEERVSRSPDANGKVEYHRAGFPNEVIAEIAILCENHERLYGLPKQDFDYHPLR